MTNEKIEQILCNWGCPCETVTCEHTEVIEAISSRLGAAVSASPQPRCPKCQSEKLVFRHIDGSANRTCAFVAVQCPICLPDGTIYLDSPAEMAQFFAAAPAQEPKVECKARKVGTAGGSYPQDCDWPFCGCDPKADKVLEASQESGYTLKKAAQEQPVENSTQKGKP